MHNLPRLFVLFCICLLLLLLFCFCVFVCGFFVLVFCYVGLVVVFLGRWGFVCWFLLLLLFGGFV